MNTETNLSPERLSFYENNKKCVVLAYAILLFGGGMLGLHYYYLGGTANKKRGKLRLILTCTIIGAPVSALLTLLDLFLLAKHASERNIETLKEINQLK